MRDRTMLMTCTGCPVRGHGCDDCVLTALYAAAPGAAGGGPGEAAHAPTPLPLDARERRAVAALLGAGLIDRETASAAHAVREELPLRRAQ